MIHPTTAMNFKMIALLVTISMGLLNTARSLPMDTSTTNALNQNSTLQSLSTQQTAVKYGPWDPYPANGDHPDWSYQNGKEWWQNDNTQQDHARFHSYLSMSVHGDYEKKCKSTFPGGFTVIHKFSQGYVAHIPEMKKVTIILKGVGFSEYKNFDWSPVSISDIVSDCANCLAPGGVKKRWLELKAETNDFAVAKQWVASTGMMFSITGHGMGGALAILGGLDLGARGHVHYAHNQGTMRVLNTPAIVRYDNLFQYLAGQSLVAKNDLVVNYMPKGPYFHVGQKAHISGDKTQWWQNCYGNNENYTCLGAANSWNDHLYYFTPIGECGSADKGF